MRQEIDIQENFLLEMMFSRLIFIILKYIIKIILSSSTLSASMFS